MERQHEEISTDEIGGDPMRLRLPSASLAFYSCTLLLLGCTNFVRLVWTDTTLFPIPTALLVPKTGRTFTVYRIRFRYHRFRRLSIRIRRVHFRSSRNGHRRIANACWLSVGG